MALQQIINDATIVDVREPWEFAEGHVEGAINIPLMNIFTNVEQFQSMERPIVLCCASGGRSGQALALLQAKGIQDIYNGGGWREVQQLKAALV